METRPVKHPTAEILKAFGLGKLDDSSSGELMAHLDLCADCRKLVASQSGDDFLDRLRQAHSRNATPAPPKSLGGIDQRPKPPPGPTTLFNLPPELADNPQYEILKELGRGGMGVVYLAKNKLMDRLEVLKVINKALLDRPGAVERFLREIRAAAKLNHVNVVVAYSALQLGDLLVFAMEYVDGQDLAAVVKANGPLPVPHACFYVQQAAQGLQHALEKKMVHRDIKPQNLILAREGRKHLVKVLDFGLAKVLQEKADDTGLTGEGKMLGTPDYMAPEQTLDATSADIRADIYSLGCTLYFLLSGTRPFKGKNLFEIMQAHQSLEATALNVARPEVPAELASVVRKMMAKDRAQRYQTPLDVVQALGPFVKQVPQKPSSQSSSGLTVDAPTAANVKPTPPQRESPAVQDARTKSVLPSATPSRSKAVRKKRRSPTVKTAARKKWLIGGGIAVIVLLLTLLGMWAGGVFKVKTKHGTIVLENLPADAVVEVDGETVKLNAGDGKPIVINVTTDRKHRLQVRKEGFKVFGQDVEIDGGERRPIRVTLEAQPAAVKTSPTAAAEDKGFVSLFNGKDLTGWKTHPDAAGDWKVEKGILIGRGPKVSHLYSQRGDYGDFHLLVEAKINQGGNSGVLFHKAFTPDWKRGYEAQIDSSSHKFKTGTLYVNAAPGVGIEKVLVPVDTWFTQEVIVQGNHILIKINGDTTADFVDADKTWPAGHIALQVFDKSTVVQFRRIEIKELPPPAAGAGFVPLFNGKDLTGWKTHADQPGNWRVENGILTGSGNGVSHLYTNRGDYANFHLRLEARLNERGNSGVYFRTPFGPNLPFDLRKPVSPSNRPTWITAYNAKIDARRFGGLLIDPDIEMRRMRELAFQPGEWLTYEIIAEGNHIVIKVNGQTTSDYVDDQRRYTKGHLALQQHGSATRAEFRNIEIKELPPP